jgi:signal transduction histidine kinase
MNIRARLTVTFFLLFIVVLTMISVSIYYFSAEYRQLDFYRRLRNRAINTAKVLVEVEEVNAELLRRMERNNPASLPGQYIVIYDSKNEISYRSDGTQTISVDERLLDKIRLRGEIKFKQGAYEVLGFVFKEQADEITIVAAATDVYGLDALRNLRNILFITFSISVVIVSILGWIYAGRILRPISNIVDEVSNITEINLNSRVEVKNKNDELGKLASTFNGMLERLQSAFSAQKTFIANASHEIKTPITVMSGEIEVGLLQNRDDEYYKNLLKSVLSGLKGLNRLSTQLLILAQTSSEQPNQNFSPLRVDDILWEVKTELTKLFRDYVVDISFNIDVDHESLVIMGDEQLLKIAVMNLIDNGCKYSDDNRVVINLNTSVFGKIGVDFTNKGPGIDPDVIEKIFDPFFRAGSNKQIKGFGIGLSLVKRIIQLHRGEIIVESAPHGETRFTLVFPTVTS